MCCILIIILNGFYGNIFCYNYVRLYIACGNLMVMVAQQHILQTQKQSKTDDVRSTVTLWHGCVNISGVKKQNFLRILSVRLLPYLYIVQSAYSILCYHVFHIWLHHNFLHYLKTTQFSTKRLFNPKCNFLIVYKIIKKLFSF